MAGGGVGSCWSTKAVTMLMRWHRSNGPRGPPIPLAAPVLHTSVAQGSALSCLGLEGGVAQLLHVYLVPHLDGESRPALVRVGAPRREVIHELPLEPPLVRKGVCCCQSPTPSRPAAPHPSPPPPPSSPPTLTHRTHAQNIQPNQMQTIDIESIQGRSSAAAT